jgi:hypothetical protein
MSLDEISDKSTVKFKRSLKEREVRELFVYLARKLNLSDFRCEYKIGEEISPMIIDGGHIYPIIKKFEANGGITPGKYYRDNGCEHAAFNGIKELGNYTEIDGIKFITSPGINLSEISRGELLLYEDTKRFADEFVDILEKRVN